MTREEINRKYLNLRNYLKENKYEGVSFDIKSYDNEKDIPAITYNYEKRKITFFEARGKETIAVVFSPYWHETIININDIDIEEFYTLLSNVYNETEESWCNGEFDEVI